MPAQEISHSGPYPHPHEQGVTLEKTRLSRNGHVIEISTRQYQDDYRCETIIFYGTSGQYEIGDVTHYAARMAYGL